MLKRWPDGIDGEPFFQKRVPDKRPEWLQTATVHFPCGRTAAELVPNDAAHLVWGVNLGIIDWNPWPVRRADLDHPDELRVDLDPHAGRRAGTTCARSRCARATCSPSTGCAASRRRRGSRGIHINVRIEPQQELHRPCAARRWRWRARSSAAMPGRATSASGGRRSAIGVFVDYNQNARDRTVASQYSVRAVPDARVSCPLRWDEVADVEPGDLRLDTVPARLREVGDPSATSTTPPARSTPCWTSPRRDEEEGLGDAPWPPHFAKQAGEPKRVQPSRARGAD